MTVSELLQRARDLMNDSGADWIQGQYQSDKAREDGSFSYCSIGALRVAASGSISLPFNSAHYRTYEVAVATLSDEIDQSDWGEYAGEVSRDRVIYWNDDENTVWEVVDATFQSAIAKAKAREVSDGEGD